MENAVLITGGARRLGAAMARAVAAAGYKVIIHARHASDDAQSLADEIHGHVVLGDLAEPEAPQAIIEAARQKAGPLYGLINNASHFEYDSAASVTAAGITAHMAPNLVAPVLLTRYFAARQSLARSVVINILDQKLSNLNPDFFSYTLSKAALAAATEMLAMALAPAVRVCAIAPGLTMAAPSQTPERFAKAWTDNPLHRGAAPEDIARTALYILQTPAITGTTITVDGGEHLMHRSRDVGFSDGV